MYYQDHVPGSIVALNTPRHEILTWGDYNEDGILGDNELIVVNYTPLLLLATIEAFPIQIPNYYYIGNWISSVEIHKKPNPKNNLGGISASNTLFHQIYDTRFNHYYNHSDSKFNAFSIERVTHNFYIDGSIIRDAHDIGIYGIKEFGYYRIEAGDHTLVTPLPLPAALMITGFGALCAVARRRRRHRAAGA
jgi:hypothetical protein